MGCVPRERPEPTVARSRRRPGPGRRLRASGHVEASVHGGAGFHRGCDDFRDGRRRVGGRGPVRRPVPRLGPELGRNRHRRGAPHRGRRRRDRHPAASSAPLVEKVIHTPRCSAAVFVTHELLRRGAVEERAYQVNIARACLERSTLVVLPTGMGKTVIAAMVIAEVLRQRGGRILFLAPTKPLVEQHAASMRNVLVVDRITLFTGEATAPEDRELLWREKKIIVSTPQVIRNDLRAERISLDDVSLIVFYEAHPAVGAYAYVDCPAADKDSPRPP